MRMNNKECRLRGYECPAAEVLELLPGQVLAVSTGGFDDGGTLPGWGDGGSGSGTGTSDFGNGGSLPGWNG